MFRSVCRIACRMSEKGVRLMTLSATPGRLDGKVAVVTASTDGIGLAIARRLGEDGAKVMVSSRKAKNVETAVAALRKDNIQVEGMVCHVGKPADRCALLKQTAEKFGGIDILVSNAGINPAFGSILDIFDINVKSAFFLTKEVIPYMEKRGGGSVVFVSSIVGYVPMELLGAYSVSKTSLLALVKAMAPQLARMNIRVNGLAPGIIKTHFSQALHESPMIAEKILENIPLGRFGETSECAAAASFLVSDDAKYIIGETILVTGGMQARL